MNDQQINPWREARSFKLLAHLVLACFYIQILNPINLGYAPSAHPQPATSYGELDAGYALRALAETVLDFLIPAAQAQEAEPDPLLASTDEFDLEDPYIVEKAEELGPDPQAIFAFVRDEIDYEVYTGSLRGARGTLWEGAGNSLDQASLMIALLRYHGIRARYVQGTLAKEDAQTLIASMFEPAPYRVIGYVPDDVDKADPVNDPELIAEAQQHFWVEFGAAGSEAAADPSFAFSSLDTAYGVITGTFPSTPTALQHIVALAVLVSSVGSESPYIVEETVLDVDLPSAGLAGKTLSLGHLVDTATSTRNGQTYITHTYTPTLLLYDADTDIQDDAVVSGGSFREAGTVNSSQNRIVSISLKINQRNPNGTVESFQRTLGSHVGLEAIARNIRIDWRNLPSLDQPIVYPYDRLTLAVAGGAHDIGVSENVAAALKVETDYLESLQQSGELTLSVPLAESWGRYATVLNALISQEFIANSEERREEQATVSMVKSYYAKPRIVATEFTVAPNSARDASRFGIDLLSNAIRAIPYPGQSIDATVSFNALHGLAEIMLESAVTEEFFSEAVQDFSTYGFVDAVLTAKDQGVEMIILTPLAVDSVDDFSLSLPTRIRIRESLRSGNIVYVTSRTFQHADREEEAWLEINPVTGVTVDYNIDGKHFFNFQTFGLKFLEGYLAKYFSLRFVLLQWGFLDAFLSEQGIDALQFIVRDIYSLGEKNVQARLQEIRAHVKIGLLQKLASLGVDALGLTNFYEWYKDPEGKLGGALGGGISPGKAKLNFQAIGSAIGYTTLLYLVDPPLPARVVGIPSTGDTSAESGQTEALLVHEPLYTLPSEFGYWQSLFRIEVFNASQNPQTFRVGSLTTSNGIELRPTVESVEIPAGETGIVGLAVLPLAEQPRRGESLSFELTVESVNGGFSKRLDYVFEAPDIVRVDVSMDPSEASSTLSGSVDAILEVVAEGNVETVDASIAWRVPEGLQVTVDGETVSDGQIVSTALTTGETYAKRVRLTPSSSASLYDFLQGSATFEFGEDLDGNPHKSTAYFFVNIVSSEHIQAIERAAQAAAEIGRVELAATLNRMAITIGQLEQAPADQTQRSRVTALFNSLIAQLTGTSLEAFQAVFTENQNALQGTDTDGFPFWLSVLADDMDALTAVLELAANPRVTNALDALEAAIAALEGDLGSADLRASVVVLTDALLAEIAESALAGFTPALTGHRDAVEAAADETALQAVLDALSATLDELRAAADELLAEDFAATLDEFSSATTRLRADPGNADHRQQVTDLLDELTGQLTDSALQGLADALTGHRDAIAAAGAEGMDTAIQSLWQTLDEVGQAVQTDAVATDFSLALSPNTDVVAPGGTSEIAVRIVNQGNVTVSYDLGLSALPDGVTGTLSKTSITLDPGQSTNGNPGTELTLSLTLPADATGATEFAVTATERGEWRSRTAQGALFARDERIELTGVVVNPTSAAQGDSVAVSIRLLDEANTERSISAHYQVLDADAIVLHTSGATAIPLSHESTYGTFALETLDTTALEQGDYQIAVTLTETDGLSIEGAEAFAALQIGAPVTAHLTIDPETVPPGDAEVDVMLDIQHVGPLNPLGITFVTSAPTPSTGKSVVVYGDYAYVCNAEEITIFDVSDIESPVAVKSFAHNEVINAASADCRIVDDHLISFSQVFKNAESLPTLVYDLIDPETPRLVSNTGFHWRFLQNVVFLERTAVMPLTTRFQGAFGIRRIDGDLVTFDFSDLSQPQFADALLKPGNPPNGGNHPFLSAISVGNMGVVYSGAGTRRSGWNSSIGRVVVVDASNPYDLKQLKSLSISGTKYVGAMAKQGEVVLAVGTQEDTAGTDGTAVLITLDARDPENPVILQVLPTTGKVGTTGGAVVSLGGGFFVTGGISYGGVPSLTVVDVNDPADIQYQTIASEASTKEFRIVDNYLLTASAAGLSVYDIAGIKATGYTASIKVPNGTGVGIVEDSFNIPPDEIIEGNDYDTLIWDRLFNELRTEEQITWEMQATGMQASEVRAVTLDSVIEYVPANGPSGEVELPAQVLVSEPLVITLTPESQSVAAGADAAYRLSIDNPTDVAAVFGLTLAGVPDSWGGLAPTLEVPAAGSAYTDLLLSVPASAGAATHGFVIGTLADFGSVASVDGSLTVVADGPELPRVGPNDPAPAVGVDVMLIPESRMAGQGTSADYIVRITNTSDRRESFELSAQFPAGIVGELAETTVELLPGRSTYRDVRLTVTPPVDTAPGTYGFAVSAELAGSPEVTDTAQGELQVSALGVSVVLAPQTPGELNLFVLTVTNTGGQTETFDLTLGGPVALFAELAANEVTLEPDASTHVLIDIAELDGMLPGQALLEAKATSRTDTNVFDIAQTFLDIDEGLGVTAQFDPATIELEQPEATQTGLVVRNTGNVLDSFSATITAVDSTLEADMQGLDGSPTQQIEEFVLPPQATGLITLDAELLDYGQGQVTVEIASKSDYTVSAQATAVIKTKDNEKPVANAGDDRMVHENTSVTLDGTESYDPDNHPESLSYAWVFVLPLPDGSALTDDDLSDPATATPSFIPDVPGEFVLELTVSDGLDTDSDRVTITAGNRPPVACAGDDQNVDLGDEVDLDGSCSSDPDGDMITYDWSLDWDLAAIPPGSGLTDDDLIDRQTPTPSFTPDVAGMYEVQLSVADPFEEPDSDTVKITASGVPDNVPPNAVALAIPSSPYVLGQVTLDGSQSNDPDNGPSPLSFAWTFQSLPAGSTLTDTDIQSNDEAVAYFWPDVTGPFELQLEVGDGADEDTAPVQVTAVELENIPPVADCGGDLTLLIGGEAVLDGSDSYDEDNSPQPLSYGWAFVSVPDESALDNTAIKGADTPVASFTPDVPGDFVVSLTVDDGKDQRSENCLVQVQYEKVRITAENHDSSLNRRTRQMTRSMDLAIENIGTATLTPPLVLEMSVSSGAVQVRNVTTKMADGTYRFDLQQKVGVIAIAPGESVRLPVEFVHSMRARFTYDVWMQGVETQ